MSTRIQGVKEKVYNGVKYRSTLEADTAETLDKLGIPFAYESRRITLLEGFHSPFQKDKIRAIHYTPDFIIGNIILECKGFETPEWKMKKKYIFKYLQEKEPQTVFYQTHNAGKDVLLALDSHWTQLGWCIEVSEVPEKGNTEALTMKFSSVTEAMQALKLSGRYVTPILRAFITGKAAYNYYWKLSQIQI